MTCARMGIRADVVLTGAATVGQIQSNVAALELGYDPELEEKLVRLLSTLPNIGGLVALLGGTDRQLV